MRGHFGRVASGTYRDTPIAVPFTLCKLDEQRVIGLHSVLGAECSRSTP